MELVLLFHFQTLDCVEVIYLESLRPQEVYKVPEIPETRIRAIYACHGASFSTRPP